MMKSCKNWILIIVAILFCSNIYAQAAFTAYPLDTVELDRFTDIVNSSEGQINFYETCVFSSEKYDLRTFIMASAFKHNSKLILLDNEINASDLGIFKINSHKEGYIENFIMANDLNFHAHSESNVSYATYLYFCLQKFSNNELVFISDLKDYRVRYGKFFSEYVVKHLGNDLSIKMKDLFSPKLEFKNQWNVLKEQFYKLPINADSYEGILFSKLLSYYDGIKHLEEIDKLNPDFIALNDSFKGDLHSLSNRTIQFIQYKQGVSLTPHSKNILVGIDSGKIKNSMYMKKHRFRFGKSSKYFSDMKDSESETAFLLFSETSNFIGCAKMYEMNYTNVEQYNMDVKQFNSFILLRKVGAKESMFYSEHIYN